MNTKNTLGMTGEQLANGTPTDKVIELKAFYKGDKATISPAKDLNGRYKGIQENIPEIKKLEMGYVPAIDSKVKIYDGLTIDLNNKEWAADWEWMKYCQEIADDFATGQASPGAYFYIFRPGFESAKKVSDTESTVKLYNYILNDSEENLYNRASILGIDMSHQVISDVKEYLLGMVMTEPSRIKAVYESKTFSLELLLMHAKRDNVIVRRNGVFTFGEILLGVDEKAVITFFANPKNHITTRAIEAVTYGVKKKANPLENEAVLGADLPGDDLPVEEKEDSLVQGTNNAIEGLKTGTTKTKGSMIQGKFISADTPIEGLSPIQKAARTRAINALKNE
jgi:hypothetical protein